RVLFCGRRVLACFSRGSHAGLSFFVIDPLPPLRYLVGVNVRLRTALFLPLSTRLHATIMHILRVVRPLQSIFDGLPDDLLLALVRLLLSWAPPRARSLLGGCTLIGGLWFWVRWGACEV